MEDNKIIDEPRSERVNVTARTHVTHHTNQSKVNIIRTAVYPRGKYAASFGYNWNAKWFEGEGCGIGEDLLKFTDNNNL